MTVNTFTHDDVNHLSTTINCSLVVTVMLPSLCSDCGSRNLVAISLQSRCTWLFQGRRNLAVLVVAKVRIPYGNLRVVYLFRARVVTYRKAGLLAYDVKKIAFNVSVKLG